MVTFIIILRDNSSCVRSRHCHLSSRY